jgi:hypothetical protein
MSDFKELALEAAARGSPLALLLVVLFTAGTVVQNQEPPDHRIFVETRSVCQSLLTGSSFDSAFPNAGALSLAASNISAAATGLPDAAVTAISFVLPLLPAAGLAREAFSGAEARDLQTRIAFVLCNGPGIKLAAVHALGQAGTFGASQLARFFGTANPGKKFFDRCGSHSATQVCLRSARQNLRVMELLPAHARPTTSTTTTTAATTTTSACRCRRDSPGENETQEMEYGYEYVHDYDLPQVETVVPALCENTAASFSELFSALHENPKFSPASLGASLVTLVFGIHLLRRGQRRRLPAPPVAENSCAWTLLEALASDALVLGGFALLVFLYSQPQNNGNEFLIGMSLGAALQAGVVLWSSYGNLFFDLRTLGSALRRGRSFFFSAAAPAPEGRESSEAIPAPARVEEVAEMSVAIGTGRPCRVV